MRFVGLLAERSVDHQQALAAELGAVGEVPGLEGVQLRIGHLRRVGRSSQEDQGENVERVGDVRIARHGTSVPRAQAPMSSVATSSIGCTERSPLRTGRDLGPAAGQGARRDGDDGGHAQQLGIGQLHAGRLVAVVVQHVDAGIGQALVEPFGRLATAGSFPAPSATSWTA